MRVWRICARRNAAKAFRGEGARLYGGRWNFPGFSIVYTAGSLALASLEMLVHVDVGELPADLVAIPADIPPNVTCKNVDRLVLAANWRDYPAPETLQRIGMEWLESGATAVLAVPSAIVPQEMNYLLNPAHSQLKQIVIGSPEAFLFDPRLWKGGRG